MQNQNTEFKAAINLSEKAIQALGQLSKNGFREWFKILKTLKPGSGKVEINCEKISTELINLGLVKPATYLGKKVPGIYRVPKEIAFASLERTI